MEASIHAALAPLGFEALQILDVPGILLHDADVNVLLLLVRPLQLDAR